MGKRLWAELAVGAGGLVVVLAQISAGGSQAAIGWGLLVVASARWLVMLFRPGSPGPSVMALGYSVAAIVVGLVIVIGGVVDSHPARRIVEFVLGFSWTAMTGIVACGRLTEYRNRPKSNEPFSSVNWEGRFRRTRWAKPFGWMPQVGNLVPSLWLEYGFEPGAQFPWIHAGVSRARDAAVLRDLGFSPEILMFPSSETGGMSTGQALTRGQLGLPEAVAWLKRASKPA